MVEHYICCRQLHIVMSVDRPTIIRSVHISVCSHPPHDIAPPPPEYERVYLHLSKGTILFDPICNVLSYMSTLHNYMTEQ